MYIIPFRKDKCCVCGVCCIFRNNVIFYFLGKSNLYDHFNRFPLSPGQILTDFSQLYRGKLNIFLQIANWTEKREANLCSGEERQKRELSSYLLRSLRQLAWRSSGPAKTIAPPAVVEGWVKRLWVVWVGCMMRYHRRMMGDMGMWIYGS